MVFLLVIGVVFGVILGEHVECCVCCHRETVSPNLRLFCWKTVRNGQLILYGDLNHIGEMRVFLS